MTRNSDIRWIVAQSMFATLLILAWVYNNVIMPSRPFTFSSKKVGGRSVLRQGELHCERV
jgi:hypothetical protein